MGGGSPSLGVWKPLSRYPGSTLGTRRWFWRCREIGTPTSQSSPSVQRWLGLVHSGSNRRSGWRSRDLGSQAGSATVPWTLLEPCVQPLQPPRWPRPTPLHYPNLLLGSSHPRAPLGKFNFKAAPRRKTQPFSDRDVGYCSFGAAAVLSLVSQVSICTLFAGSMPKLRRASRAG